jgi:hypothetical protein
MATKKTPQSTAVEDYIEHSHPEIMGECEQHESRDFIVWLTRKDGVRKQYRVTRESFQDTKWQAQIDAAASDLISN